MKLTPYDERELRGIRAYTKNFELLMEFKNSDLKCAKVENFTHVSAHSCANSFRQAIRRYRFYNIDVCVRKGCVFLIKKEI